MIVSQLDVASLDPILFQLVADASLVQTPLIKEAHLILRIQIL